MVIYWERAIALPFAGDAYFSVILGVDVLFLPMRQKLFYFSDAGKFCLALVP